MDPELLKVRNLKKYFPIKAGLMRRTVNTVKAVDDVSLSIRRGETLGLVGESGCGKSTLGRTIMRLIEPTAGEIHFDGRDFRALNYRQLKRERKGIQMIFQDPYASLNPRRNVTELIGEPMVINGFFPNAAERKDRVRELLLKVDLNEAAMKKYPHEFSGGQRQRIGIARALAVEPKLIVADEPVSALDVSIQAQVINLLQDLQDEMNLSFLFIAHDLSVVKHISHQVAVMYLGRVVESGPKKVLFGNPLHPYTRALFDAIPVPDPLRRRQKRSLRGDLPSPLFPPPGCAFNPRCPLAEDICREKAPQNREFEPGHFAVCHMIS